MRDGFRRTTRKNSIMTLMNVITKCGSLVTYDEFMFPIKEGVVQDEERPEETGDTVNCFLSRDKSMAENI